MSDVSWGSAEDFGQKVDLTVCVRNLLDASMMFSKFSKCCCLSNVHFLQSNSTMVYELRLSTIQYLNGHCRMRLYILQLHIADYLFKYISACIIIGTNS